MREREREVGRERTGGEEVKAEGGAHAVHELGASNAKASSVAAIIFPRKKEECSGRRGDDVEAAANWRRVSKKQEQGLMMRKPTREDLWTHPPYCFCI